TVAGVAEFYRRQNQKIGLIWIDAHSDMNTPETSPSGNVHGMPLAAIMGLGPSELGNIFNFSPKVRPENCVLVGIRDVDSHEKENIRKAGVEVFTMRDIDERGMRAVMEEALRMAGRGTAGYHVSLDMDWIDPEDAPGVGTPGWGGRNLPRSAPRQGNHRRPRAHAQLRDRGSEPCDRRTQSDRRSGRRAVAIGLRQEDLVVAPNMKYESRSKITMHRAYVCTL